MGIFSGNDQLNLANMKVLKPKSGKSSWVCTYINKYIYIYILHISELEGYGWKWELAASYMSM